MSIARLGLRYIALIWLLVILSVGSVIYAGHYRNREDLRSLLVAEAERLITMVSIAAESSIHALDEVEILTAERLLDNARHIERMTRRSIPSQQELQDIAAENGLYNISILDNNGEIIIRSLVASRQNAGAESRHRPEVMDVLDGSADYRVIGFMDNSYSAGNRYGVVVGARNVGAIVVNTDSDEMLAFRKAVGLGTMFRDIGQEEDVRYIALQDSIGIVAASPGITQMTSIRDDQFLTDGMAGSRQSRFTESDGENLLEIVAPLIVDDFNLGLMRIGLGTGGFQDISDRSARHFFLLFLVAAASAAFLFMYTMLRQNYTLLNHEHDRMLKDVHRMEEESQRTERLSSMGRLAAGVAHEVRNPLNSISMLVQILGTDFEVREGEERYKGFISSISSEIARIGLIVENFLTYARPKKLAKKDVALASIVGEVLSIVREKAKGDNIQLYGDIAPDISCLCDIDQMKQVILNLVLNAVEAVGENGDVTVSAINDAASIVLTVQDSGGGIAEDTMSSIFDPYFTTKEKGSGLGLSEVYRIVGMHGGTVQAVNTDKGAVFTVSIPTVKQ